MAKGGSREGAGRKPGVPNKRTAEQAAKIEASGLTPLEFMMNIMRDEGADTAARFEAAKAAAPYVHPRLSSVDNTGEAVRNFVARIPHKATSTDQWLQQHAPPPLKN